MWDGTFFNRFENMKRNHDLPFMSLALVSVNFMPDRLKSREWAPLYRQQLLQIDTSDHPLRGALLLTHYHLKEFYDFIVPLQPL